PTRRSSDLPFVSATSIPMALALFHTVFNVLNVLLMVGFIGIIVRTVIKMVPSRGDDDVFSLDYIGSGMMDTPELSIMEAKKELAKFGSIMKRGYKYVPRLITEMEEKKFRTSIEKLEKYEDISDRMEVEISTYLSKAGQGELSVDARRRLRAMINVANHLERIGDIYLEVSRNLKDRKSNKAYFTPEMRERVLGFSELIKNAFEIMVQN